MQSSSLAAAAGDINADAASDEALAALARVDTGAFETLYLRHRSGLFRFARGRTGDDDAAADLVSTTFERALRSIARYHPESTFRAWLYRIARNELIDASRRRATILRHTQAVVAARSVDAGPEAAMLEAESADLIRDLVRELPDLQRDAVLLRYASGLTAREIGVTLGRSEAAAQKLLQRALAVLKEAYRDND